MSMDELRERLSPEALVLFDAARALIREVDENTVEVAWPHQKTAGFGVGPKKMSEQYIYLTCHARHINLGFYYGAALDDPHALLSGAGKSMRSMRVDSLQALQREGLRELMARSTAYLPKLKR